MGAVLALGARERNYPPNILTIAKYQILISQFILNWLMSDVFIVNWLMGDVFIVN